MHITLHSNCNDTMDSLDQYQMLSHFQQLYTTKLVVLNVEDITIYIADNGFFDKYQDKRYEAAIVIPSRSEKYINCNLDGSEYIVVNTKDTCHLLNNS